MGSLQPQHIRRQRGPRIEIHKGETGGFMKRVLSYLIAFVGFAAHGATNFSAAKTYEVCSAATDAKANSGLLFSLAIHREQKTIEMNMSTLETFDPSSSLIKATVNSIRDDQAHVVNLESHATLTEQEKTELGLALKNHFQAATVSPTENSNCIQIKLHPAEIVLNREQIRVGRDVLEKMKAVYQI